MELSRVARFGRVSRRSLLQARSQHNTLAAVLYTLPPGLGPGLLQVCPGTPLPVYKVEHLLMIADNGAISMPR